MKDAAKNYLLSDINWLLDKKWLLLLTLVTVPPALYLWLPFGMRILQSMFG